MNSEINKYFQLRSEIDKITALLFDMHNNHIECKKGCDLCCMDYSIFPVEFYSIIEEMKKNAIPSSLVKESENDNRCIFLKNHECLIYNSRPIICRTHGLPLLYTNKDGEWELSACELNFTNFNADFTEENTFSQDKFNSKLFMLNKEFIKKYKSHQYSEFDLIPIKDFLKYTTS